MVRKKSNYDAELVCEATTVLLLSFVSLDTRYCHQDPCFWGPGSSPLLELPRYPHITSELKVCARGLDGWYPCHVLKF